MRNFINLNHSAVSVDQGLRSYMQFVYAYMSLGTALSGAIAYYIASSPSLLRMLALSPLGMVFMLAPIGISLALGFRIQTMRLATAQMLFWLYAACFGVALSTLFVVYTSQSIAQVFFMAAFTFAATSLYGYVTKRDLTSLGSFLFMGLIGLVSVNLGNMFFKSQAISLATSYISVLVFVGYTAYDTQQIKMLYYDSPYRDSKKDVIIGALRLYTDFLNLFISLLRIMGNRRD